jgi:heterotetrameric sarcosine oxidase gamma subunit
MSEVASVSSLAPLSVGAAFEIVAGDFDGRLPDAGDQVSQDSSTRMRPLPLGPGRWLWLDPDPDEANAVAATGAYIVDVEGKWTAFTCGGPQARRALSAAIDVDSLLEARDCAAVALFDCPAVLARTGDDGFIVCVQSSYAASFEAAYTGAANQQ